MEHLKSVILNATDKLKTNSSQKSPITAKDATQIAALCVATYLIATKVYTAYFGPLREIPGPTLYKFVPNRWIINDRPAGTIWRTYYKWHDQYGKVIRIGPNIISVADKDMIRQALVTDIIPKGPGYQMQKDEDANTFNTIDKVHHKRRRRILSPAFSVKFLASLESYMTSMTENLIRRIDRDISACQGSSDGFGTVDIWHLLQCLAIDIVGDTCFGSSFQMLEKNDHFVPRTISLFMESICHMCNHPFLGPLLTALSLSKSVKEFKRLQMFMNDIIMKRIEGGEEARRPDILQQLIDTMQAPNPEDRFTFEDVAKETVLFLIAGSETTGSTTGFAFVHLMENPEILARLQAEIDAVPLDPNEQIFSHSQLRDLPYLNAVIHETMRLNNMATQGLERMTDKDMILGGHMVVPKGTVVFLNLMHAQTNPQYWPSPFQFKPERWIVKGKFSNDVEAFYPFSLGARNCIAKNFGLQEMRLSIAALVKHYDMRAIPEELAHAKDRRQFITLNLAKHSFKIQVRRRTADP
ncbi:cytochrome P450 [Syncephalastrum racemosum]|uniref:Cytochrome P450 n=1 Tax=Syncephalastrum racemosum TaxID=13706 RepID=A0A1X2HTE4_SYNRA|nr:cytochrome P450 [Syncephalastrum racemosum]